ncbi:hypothetical protein OBBRIDRAFT_832559 [Obba rivulosa]|uniref:BTB domain-containing protein n=1 Tax=Obba rivulosa TaxID=1052685 RepID=A0A8E2DPM5_9APHY|nr:hypothetical protein OBBRIDRAFT_832559 [Obba rivulosa]
MPAAHVRLPSTGSLQSEAKQHEVASGTRQHEAASEAKRHERFYFEDGTVVFLMEDTLFKIYQFFKQGSPIFRDMYSIPSPPDQEVEGSTDGNAIVLHDTKVADFESLLAVFFPNALLELALKWHFDEIRDVAIEQLKKQGVASLPEQIRIADLYDPKDWLKAARIEFCQQGRRLTLDQARRVRVDETLLL